MEGLCQVHNRDDGDGEKKTKSIKKPVLVDGRIMPGLHDENGEANFCVGRIEQVSRALYMLDTNQPTNNQMTK